MRRTITIYNIPNKVEDDVVKRVIEKAMKVVKEDEKLVLSNEYSDALTYKIVKRNLYRRFLEAIETSGSEEWSVDYKEIEADCLGA